MVLIFMGVLILLGAVPIHAGEPGPAALPTGGVIAGGTGSIHQDGTSMTVTQESSRLITNWQDFSIGRDASVSFKQPSAGSIALNRVKGQSPSQIFGQLSANGHVMLINPAGIIIGAGSQIDVGALTASTLNLSDTDFLTDIFHFSGSGGNILNQGNIDIAGGGTVAFISPAIKNEGRINAPQNAVAMIEETDLEIDFTGDGLITFTVKKDTVDELSENKELVQIEDGVVILTDQAADELTLEVVNNSDIVEAESITYEGGRVILDSTETYKSVDSPSLTAQPASEILPTGGHITSGTGNIDQNGSTMLIKQESEKLIANWQEFNIGRDSIVTFNQPSSSSIALNRVVGNVSSQILGRLNANGHLMLVNPAGVVFGAGSQIDVGALTTSLLNISDADFLTDRFQFSGGEGSILNQGNISVASGGTVAFISPVVQNEGTITAPQGSVSMIAGTEMEVDFTGDGLVNFLVSKGAAIALAENRGLIQADDGVVILTAQAINSLTGAVVNNEGNIAARGISSQGGRIILDSGAGGLTRVSGTLDTDAATDKGGHITITGDHIKLKNEADISAIGTTGGGEVLVGGDWQGSGSLQQATYLTMDAGVQINASASVQGDGGKVVLWSDAHNPDSLTKIQGSIFAQGGVDGGYGGQVETSGYSVDITDIQVHAGSADSGSNGLWLIDPFNYTIDSAIASTIVTSLNGGTDVSLSTETENQAMGSTTTGSDAGNIAVNSNIISNGSGVLTLEADNMINFGVNPDNTGLIIQAGGIYAYADNGITLDSKGLTMTANNAGSGDIVLASDRDGVDGGNIRQDNGVGTITTFGSSSFSTNGGDIIMAGNAEGTTYAVGAAAVVGDIAGSAEGVRFFGDTSMNTDGGNIIVKGKSWATNIIHDGWGAYGVGFDSANDFNSGTGTIFIDGISQSWGNGDFALFDFDTPVSAGVLFNQSGGSTSITSANTTPNAIIIQGDASAAGSNNALAGGVVFNSSNTNSITATGTGGGISITGKRQGANDHGEDITFTSASTEILANGGPITLTGQIPGEFIRLWNTTLGSKGGSAVTTSNSDITLTTDRPLWATNNQIANNSSSPLTVNTHGTFSLLPFSTQGFSEAIDTTMFAFNGITGLTVGSDTNTQSIHVNKATSVDGTISLLAGGSGGEIHINKDLSSTGVEAAILIKAATSLNIEGPLSIISDGSITLTTDNFTTLNPGVLISGSGVLNIEPFSTGTTIGLAGGAGTLALPSAYFETNFADGFSNITIGNATSGLTTIGSSPISYSDNLILKTGNSIFFSTNTAMTGNGLSDLTLWSRAGGNDTADDGTEGSVWMPVGSSIDTNGGDLIIGGGSNPATGYALGDNGSTSAENNARYRGVTINGAISADGGNISIAGRGNTPISSSRGVSIGGDISTTEDGSITLSGIAQGLSDGLALGDSSVVGATGTLSAVNGNINLYGIKNSGINGINLSTGSSSIVLNETGKLTMDSIGNINGTVGSIYVAGETALAAGVDDIILTNESNDFGGPVSVTSGRNIAITDSNSMTMGTIISSGQIDIATLTGDLTLTGNISTTATTADAIKMNAEKNKSAGDSTGGNILISTSPLITTGSGGRATLYSGSISDSSGLTTLIGTGSGHFRYSSDETTTNYTSSLMDGLYAIYREQPMLLISASDTITYGEEIPVYTVVESGHANGETDALLTGTAAWTALSGTTSTSGHFIADTYNVGYTGGLNSGLGYAMTDNIAITTDLTINRKVITFSGLDAADKIYDTTTEATLNTESASLSSVISGDLVNMNASSAIADFADPAVGIDKIVNISGVTIDGIDAGNYILGDSSAVANADIIAQAPDQNSTSSPTPDPDPDTEPGITPALLLLPGPPVETQVDSNPAPALPVDFTVDPFVPVSLIDFTVNDGITAEEVTTGGANAATDAEPTSDTGSADESVSSEGTSDSGTDTSSSESSDGTDSSGENSDSGTDADAATDDNTASDTGTAEGDLVGDGISAAQATLEVSLLNGETLRLRLPAGMSVDIDGISINISLGPQSEGDSSTYQNATSTTTYIFNLKNGMPISTGAGIVISESGRSLSVSPLEIASPDIKPPSRITAEIKFVLSDDGHGDAEFTIALSGDSIVLRPGSEQARAMIEVHRDLVVAIALAEVKKQLHVQMSTIHAVFIELP